MIEGLPKLPPLNSEEVEPAMAKIMCHLYAKCEEAGDDYDKLYVACNKLYYAMWSINVIAICARPNQGSNLSHFSISSSNEYGKACKYIEEKLGFDADKQWGISLKL